VTETSRTNAPIGRRPALAMALASVLSLALGVFLGGTARSTPARADDHDKAKAATGVKAPIEEILHCPLAFAGVHLMKDSPERSAVAYHFCKPLNADVNQCVLYDGTGPNAKLIGIEYLVTDAMYQKFPAEEKQYWHDHGYEVDAGLIRSLTQTGDDEKATLKVVRTLWGKVYHTWAAGEDYPQGPARLFWSVTGKAPLTLPKGAKLPPELKLDAK
jgi:Protein of unknown function (DUF1264)